MTVLLKDGAVFLHIPKTGGSWVYNVLTQYNLVQSRLCHEHADWDRSFWHDRFYPDRKVLKQLLRATIGTSSLQRMKPDAFRFCFVREPLKWYEFYWRFMVSRDWEPWGASEDPYKWHPNALLNQLGDPDFNVFMHNVNKKRAGYVTEMYSSYIKPEIGFVGKQESLEADLIKALLMIYPKMDVSGVSSVERVNETPSHIPKPEWDPKLKKETFRLEYASYVRFGYPVDEKAFT